MSLHLIPASITCYLGNEERSMLRIRAENGRPLGGVKWPVLLFWLPPPGGTGLNIDMQHYKTRLLSGCRVTASWLSIPCDTHTHTHTLINTHMSTRCLHTHYKICVQCIGSVAYCDDCSLSGDGETFTAPVVAIFVCSSCVIVFLWLFSYFFYSELTSSFLQFLSLPLLSQYT